jgi:hypothetical protein
MKHRKTVATLSILTFNLFKILAEIYIKFNTARKETHRLVCLFSALRMVRFEPISMRYAGGISLRPVQTLVDTIIFAPEGAKMQIESTIRSINHVNAPKKNNCTVNQTEKSGFLFGGDGDIAVHIRSPHPPQCAH